MLILAPLMAEAAREAAAGEEAAGEAAAGKAAAGEAAGPDPTCQPSGFVSRSLLPSNAAIFLLMSGAVMGLFSARMSRLVCLLAPPASALSGAAIGGVLDQLLIEPLLAIVNRSKR